MRELGDFQTPPALVSAVLRWLAPNGSRWRRALEPTCGRGHFLTGLLDLEPPLDEVHGLEIQEAHLEEARKAADAASRNRIVRIERGDVFARDLRQSPPWSTRGPLLIVGNPPWVTSAELGLLDSTNHPEKSNVHRSSGLDARTGEANFDLAEAVWIKLLREFGAEPDRVTVALLCKVSVARRVLMFAARNGLALADAAIVRLDARAWFQASVDACLLRVTLDSTNRTEATGLTRIPVYAGFDSESPESILGLVRGLLVTDLSAYEPVAYAEGQSPCVWRQGIKHDAAPLMELERDPQGIYRNRAGEEVDLEPGHVLPLLKGTDLARGRNLHDPRRAVVVTQRRVGEETRTLAGSAPRLWNYLSRHHAALAARRSSVYRSQPPYAMFGVGPYTFAPFKTAVSSLHRDPCFRVLGPVDGRPILLDDTCYFVPSATPERAALIAALANLPDARQFLRAVGGSGSKRVVTKALLQRLDLRALLRQARTRDVLDPAHETVVQLAGRPPDWPASLETLLDSDGPY
ncbi:MAG: class I SAM-dependent methyltransferase [Isosphaeraceae bacterium]